MQTSPLRNAELRAVLAITFVVMLGFGLVAPTLPLYAESFGVSYAAVGLLISAFGFMRLVSQPFGGGLIDRFGERRVAIGGVLIVGVSALAAGLAPNFPFLLAVRAAGGVGSAWFITSLTSYVMGVVPKDGAGRALSVYQGSFTAGVTMGPVAGGFLAANFGLRAPFLAYAGFCGASAVVAAVVLRRGVPHGRAATPAAPTRTLLRDRTFRLALGANAAMWWLLGGSRVTLVPLFAERELGASEAWIGTALTVAAVASLVTLPHAGRLADRLDRRTLAPALLGTAAVAAMFGVIEERTLFGAALAAMGVLQGYARVPTAALVADVSEEGNRGRAVAAQQMAGDTGGMVAPFVAGALASAFGFGAAFGALAVLPALVAVWALWAGGGGQSRPRRPPSRRSLRSSSRSLRSSSSGPRSSSAGGGGGGVVT